MDDILDEFVAEIRDMLPTVSGEIVAWEANPDDRGILDSIFRFFHTVKGNCGFFDLPHLEQLAHAAEGALSDVRSKKRAADAQLISAILAAVDRIAEMIGSIESGEPDQGGDDRQLLALLTNDGSAAEHKAKQTEETILQAARAFNSRTVRLPVDLLDRVMSGVSDIVLARNDFARRLRELPEDSPLIGHFDRLSALISDVRERMTHTRMQPIETLFRSFPRLVRDLSQQLDKQVQLDFDSGDVELDREMIEQVRDPIIHIIRNAIDHGIETTADRTAKGKDPAGLLQIAARQSGNQIFIQVNDDGRGIDTGRIVEKSIAAGIITPEQASQLSMAERHMLICVAGLSTADSVTEISGRGVGMDVVRANIEQIGGAVDIQSVPGQGTQINLRLPLTLSITPSLIIECGGQKFAIPRSYIKEVLDLRGNSVKLHEIGDAVQIEFRGTRLPCLSLSDLLGLDEVTTHDISPLAVIHLPGGDTFTLRVDRLLDHEELVIKPLAPALMATGYFAGTTLTDDGDLVLLLDVIGLARAGGLSLDFNGRTARISDERRVEDTEAAAIRVVVFTGLDGVQKAIRMSAVERIETGDFASILQNEYGQHIVIGGVVYPLIGGQDNMADHAETLRILRLRDANASLALACTGHTDIVSVPVKGSFEGAQNHVERIVLIDGKPVELLNAHRLIAEHGSARESIDQPLCRLPRTDEWTQTFLRPLIEAAGYRIVDEADDVEADVIICDSDTQENDAGSGEIIRLSDSPDAAAADTDVIYRFDQAALIAALGAARRKCG